MINNRLGWIKFWRDFRNSELYYQPSVCLVYTEMCFRHSDRNQWVTKEELIYSLQMSHGTVEKALSLLLNNGFIVENSNLRPKRYTLNINCDVSQPTQETSAPVGVMSDNTMSMLVMPAAVDDRKLRDEFLANDSQIAMLLSELNITHDELRVITDQILNDWQLSEKRHANRSDFMTHLLSTIRIKARINQQNRAPYMTEQQRAANELRAKVAAIVARRMANPNPEVEIPF